MRNDDYGKWSEEMNGKNSIATEPTCFITVVNSKEGADQARLMIESLRSFGGELKDFPLWIFTTRPEAIDILSDIKNTDIIPLDIEDEFRYYPLSSKVFACARAEERMQPEVHSLVWLGQDCLIVNPPVLFELSPTFDASFRPVHIKNVGSPAQEPPDDYWKEVYQAIGIDVIPFVTESFVDSQILRPYFNTHCFSIDPTKGILRAWREYFKLMISNEGFQAGPCQDELHQVFLHQVVLSALVTKLLDKERIRILPPEYSYPLHFQQEIPKSRRIRTLNRTVCAVYEEKDFIDNIKIQEPLKSWLKAH
jgi:hypothetical protein